MSKKHMQTEQSDRSDKKGSADPIVGPGALMAGFTHEGNAQVSQNTQKPYDEQDDDMG